MLYLVGKQAYKPELPKKWRIYNMLHILLLEHNSTKKEQVDKNVTKLDTSNNKKY